MGGRAGSLVVFLPRGEIPGPPARPAGTMDPTRADKVWDDKVSEMKKECGYAPDKPTVE